MLYYAQQAYTLRILMNMDLSLDLSLAFYTLGGMGAL